MTTDDVRHEAEIDGMGRHRRALASGFGDAMGRATEIALLPAIFGGLGWLLDRWLDTRPLFFVALLVFAFAGMLVRMWLGYDAAMRRHEVELTDRLAAVQRQRRAERRRRRRRHGDVAA